MLPAAAAEDQNAEGHGEEEERETTWAKIDSGIEMDSKFGPRGVHASDQMALTRRVVITDISESSYGRAQNVVNLPSDLLHHLPPLPHAASCNITPATRTNVDRNTCRREEFQTGPLRRTASSSTTLTSPRLLLRLQTRRRRQAQMHRHPPAKTVTRNANVRLVCPLTLGDYSRERQRNRPKNPALRKMVDALRLSRFRKERGRRGRTVSRRISGDNFGPRSRSSPSFQTE